MAAIRTESTDAATGEVTVTFEEAPDAPPPSALDVIAQLDPATAAAAVAAGAGLVAKAGDLWDALLACSHTNTARPAIEVITDIALNAALPAET